MNIYQPYTYHIGWSSINKHYYGVRFAKNCNPDDLLVSYFTSSKIVKQYRKEYGEPDIIEIRKTFNTANDALRWECKVLRRLNILKNENWLNANIGGEQFIIQKHKPETIEKMKLNNVSKRAEMKKMISERQTGSGNSFFGKKHTEETKERIRSKLKDIPKSEEHRSKYIGENNYMFGKHHSDETKQKISIAIKSIPKVECPHCKTLVDKGNAVRWHFDSCKIKSELPTS